MSLNEGPTARALSTEGTEDIPEFKSMHDSLDDDAASHLTTPLTLSLNGGTTANAFSTDGLEQIPEIEGMDDTLEEGEIRDDPDQTAMSIEMLPTPKRKPAPVITLNDTMLEEGECYY